MFLRLFTDLRAAKVPVTLREYLTLLEGVEADLAEHRVDEFYYLARATLVKDERHLDRFDQVFAQVFKGLETLQQAIEEAGIPEEWLRKLAEKFLTDEEKAQIEALGWDKLWETLKQRLDEQKGRHERFGASLYLLEPNLKQGIGALRDLSTALWAAQVRWHPPRPACTSLRSTAASSSETGTPSNGSRFSNGMAATCAGTSARKVARSAATGPA